MVHFAERVHAAVKDRRRHVARQAPLELVQVARDQAEVARRAADAASLSKSQFLANMSHEIRTPLGAIMGFLICSKVRPIPPPISKKYISTIDRNSIQLLRLIDDILDLSKVEAASFRSSTSTFRSSTSWSIAPL